jgi:hypothetical protein
VWLLRSVLDRIVLLAGVLAAGCVPGFITQYRQRLGGRLDQVLMDLAPFQAIAEHEHHGSLPELVQYHLQSSDPTFHQEGMALQSLMHSADQLRSMVQALNTDLPHQCLYLLWHADLPLLSATWADYRPVFALDLQGTIFALVIGIALWVLFLFLWHGLAGLMRLLGRARPVRSAPPPRREPRL